VLGACRFWRVGEAGDSAALTVSELVANAVRAGRGEQLLLRLSYTPRRLRVEVCDEAPEEPRLRAANTSAENGRGLWIVSALAVRWGTKMLRHGKCVWAEIALPNHRYS
jgi:anti-sigma regulatory factor (Ser/Thr protein kinase)